MIEYREQVLELNDKYVYELEKLINGKIFIGNNSFPIFIEEIFIVSEQGPSHYSKKLQVSLESVFHFK